MTEAKAILGRLISAWQKHWQESFSPPPEGEAAAECLANKPQMSVAQFSSPPPCRQSVSPQKTRPRNCAESANATSQPLISCERLDRIILHVIQ